MATSFQNAQLLREALSILDGGQEKGALTVYNGDPNGNVTGTIGALCIDYSGSGKLWKNSTGSTTWVELGSGGATDIKTTQLIYTPSPVSSNEYSNFNTLYTDAYSLVAEGLTVEIKLLQNLTISNGNDWDFSGMIFIGNGSAFAPINFVIQDSTGTQATFDLTAVSATPGDYFEHYVELRDDENALSYIWFDTTGTDPEPPAISAATEPKIRVDVSAIASADDVATAISAAVAGDTYLNSKFTTTPTAAVVSFTLNFNGPSSTPISSTANITVGSFVSGVLGTTLTSNTRLHLRNISFAFDNYNTQRAWKVNNANPSPAIIIQAVGEGDIAYSIVNSSNCSIAPVEIQAAGQLFVIQDGLTTLFNISNNPFIFINGGNLSLFPENSLFGYGSGGNITGSTGSVYLRMGRYFPQVPRSEVAFGSFTGSVASPDLYQYQHISHIIGMPNLTEPNKLLLSNGNNEVSSDVSENVVGIGKVDAYADSNINIATLDTSVTIDGLTLTNPARVYLGNQTNPVENGVYIVTDTAPATREGFYLGALYRIIGGNTHNGKWVKNTNTLPFTLDTDPLTQELTSLTSARTPIELTGTGTLALFDKTNYNVNPAANTTLTLTDPIPGSTYVFRIKQGATPYTVGFSSSPTIKWKGGVAYVATNSANAIDLVSIYFDGVDFLGVFGGDFS